MTDQDRLDAALQPLGSAAAAVKRLGHGEAALRWVLSRYWPGSDGSDSEDMSALDCMVIVIRHICAHSCFLGTSEFEDYVVNGGDVVLQLAMSDLTIDTPEMLSRVQKARDAAFKRILAEAVTQVQFRIVTKMSSLWQLQDFRLYQPLIEKAAGSEFWADNPNEPATSWVVTSLLHWDMTVHATFQELLESKTGWYRDEAGNEFTRHCASPAFLRVRLIPKESPDENFSIDTVGEVTLPRLSVREEKVKSGESGHWVTQFRPVGRERYYLLAVVKLREDMEESDRVRLYDMQGNNVTPNGNLAPFGSVLDDSWSMREQSNTYMLFYAKAGTDTPVQGREMEEVHSDSVTSLERRDAHIIGSLFKPGPTAPKPSDYSGDDDEGDEDENELLKRRKRKSDIIRNIRKRSQSLAEKKGPQAQETSRESSVTEDPMKKEALPAAKKSKQSFKEGPRTPKRRASTENDIVST